MRLALDETKAFLTATNLDAIQDFIDHLDPGVFVLHLLGLQLLGEAGQHNADGRHDDHEGKPGKDGRPHDDVEEDERHGDLVRAGPNHLQGGHHVHEPLGIHRHQVHYLSRCGRLARGIGEPQCLHQKHACTCKR